MRLVELDPKWLTRDGKHVGFVFRNPVRGSRGWWTSCMLEKMADDEQEKLIEATLGSDAMCQQCNPACAWKITNGEPESADFATISITPSLDGGPNLWHGHITNGEIK